MNHPADADPPQLEQDLCTVCAACCDGTMFSYVELDADEASALAHLFTVEAGKKGPVFYQPCPQSVDRHCQVYAERPHTCRNFRCKTLDALHKGEIESTEAKRRVSQMIDARAQLKSLLIDGETLNTARDRRQQIASNPARSASETAFLLKLTAFDLLLDRYFRNPGSTMFQANPSGVASGTRSLPD